MKMKIRLLDTAKLNLHTVANVDNLTHANDLIHGDEPFLAFIYKKRGVKGSVSRVSIVTTDAEFQVRVIANTPKKRVYQTHRIGAGGCHQHSPTATYEVTTLSEMGGVREQAARNLTRRLNRVHEALDRLDAGDTIAEAVGA